LFSGMFHQKHLRGPRSELSPTLGTRKHVFALIQKMGNHLVLIAFESKYSFKYSLDVCV
jgi:hypothetical protein